MSVPVRTPNVRTDGPSKRQEFHRIASVTGEQDLTDVFVDKLCKLPGVTSLQLKPDAVPAVMVNRRVPTSILCLFLCLLAYQPL